VQQLILLAGFGPQIRSHKPPHFHFDYVAADSALNPHGLCPPFAPSEPAHRLVGNQKVGISPLETNWLAGSVYGNGYLFINMQHVGTSLKTIRTNVRISRVYEEAPTLQIGYGVSPKWL
jgi:hypothetical protein